MQKNTASLVLEDKLSQYHYYYAHYKSSENIFIGKNSDTIFDRPSKSNLGDILVSVLSDKDAIINVIQNTINRINMHTSVDETTDQKVLYNYLVTLQRNLEQLNSYFKYMNFAVCCSKKFLENNNSKVLLSLINSQNKSSIKEYEKRVLLKAEEELKNLKNSSFQEIILDALDSFIRGLNLFNIKVDLFYNLLEVKVKDLEKSMSPLNLFTLLNKYDNAIKNETLSKLGIVLNDDISLDTQIKSLTKENTADATLKIINIYKFETILELLNISFVFMINEDVVLKRCKHCNKYFIPENRVDELYCNRINPQNRNRTCKEFGAKNTYIQQMKERPIDTEHTRTVQALRMRNRRKPSKEHKKALDNYMSEYKSKKKQFQQGKLTEKDIVEWIKTQK